MKTRPIGNTGLSISEIGFGCGGNAGLMLRGLPQEQEKIIARALELGINYFDNAPDYGDGLAETNLGKALKALGQRPLLNSKVEIRQRDFGDIAAHVVRSCEESMKRLGVDYLDVFQVHNGPAAQDPKIEGKVYTQLHIDQFLGPKAFAGKVEAGFPSANASNRTNCAMEGIERLKRDGKIRVAGFICRGNDGEEVRKVLDTGIFHIINVPYTLLNPTAGMPKPHGFNWGKDFGDVISYAHAHGASANVYAPLAGGFLTDDAIAGNQRHPLARAADPASEAVRKNATRAAQFRFLADARGCTLAQAACRFVLDHKGVSAALAGISSLEQLEEIVAATELAPISPSEFARLNDIWAAVQAP
jgi:aryl-alcohol dehydrogenase-like predicted oxidoreductase